MPHINRIRLVNVNYNDAKSIYDDFNMRLDGKSTTYDLINTGGKSMLILMLLQTVLPNTYLKKEKHGSLKPCFCPLLYKRVFILIRYLFYLFGRRLVQGIK